MSLGIALGNAIEAIERKVEKFFKDRVVNKEELSGCKDASKFKI